MVSIHNIDTFYESDFIFEEIQKKIFDNRIIQVKGEDGSGKSYLVEKVHELITTWENWSSYYICGLSPDVEPYATLYNGHCGKFIVSELDLSLSGFTKWGLGAGIAVAHKDKKDFSPDEYSIVNRILESSEQDILIVADDYFLWDEQSKNLLNTLILKPDIFIQKDKKLHVILVTDEIHADDIQQFKRILGHYPVYSTHVLDSIGMRKYLNKGTYSYLSDKISDAVLDYIKSLTGGNMNMIHTILEICKDKLDIITVGNDINESIQELVTYRIRKFCSDMSNDINTEEILSIATLFESGFTLEELAYITQKDTIDLLKLLVKAQQEDIIRDLPPYIFSCDPIQKVLSRNIEGRQQLYYQRQYKLLCKKTPQNYYQRAKCLSKFKQNDSTVIYLCCLAYARYKLSYNDMIMCNEILEFTQQYAKQHHNSSEITESNYNFERFLEIIDDLHSKNYENAYRHAFEFRRTTNILIESEIRLIALHSFVLFNESTSSIRELIEEAVEILPIIRDKEEFEEYIRLLLTIMPIMIDKLNDVDSFDDLRRDLNKTLLNNDTNPFLLYAQATLQRKASLYRSYDTAYTDTAQAIHFFSNNKMDVDLYYALCNHSGNLLVRNDYEQAIISAQEALKIANNNPAMNSRGKPENNLIIGTLLRLEDSYLKHEIEENILKIEIEKNIEKLKFKVSGDGDASNVIKANQCSLLAYIGDFKSAMVSIQDIEASLSENNDDFYIYFLNNIKLGIAIVNGEWSLANDILHKLDFIPALFHKSKRLICKRNEIISKIINQKENLTSIEYNFEIYNKLNRFSDISWRYFSRGFPISDLQFNSQ